MPGGYHSNSLLFKAHTALAHPLPPITLYPIPRMGVRHRESTPAGLLLIGYFSFLLLCYCHNFLFFFTLHWLASCLFLFLLLFRCFRWIPAMVSRSLLSPNLFKSIWGLLYELSPSSPTAA